MAEFTVKTAEQIRDDILRTYEAGLVRIGVTNPAVGPGSDVYILAQAIGNQLEVAMANAQIKAEGLLPDTAVGEELDRWLNLYGLPRRSAAGGTGAVILDTTATTFVTVGSQLIDNLGLRYEVTIGGSYADGATIPVEAVDTGTDTNHAAGDVLTWVQPPPFANQKAEVATGGITGGVDSEDDETARQRLGFYLANPSNQGNASHVARWAEASTTLVQKAFVYPAANGPGNMAVCVVGYATDVSKSRAVNSVIVANEVKPYIEGLAPEPIDLVVYSATDTNFDVAFALTLPASPKASPPGPGGGWTDGTTWPRNANLVSTFFASVTAVTSTTVFTVNAPSAPVSGITQVCWLSPYDWTLYAATVQSYTGTAGAYTITLDKPFPGISVGCFISPHCVNAQVYFDAILTQFAGMGPGEVVASSSYYYARAFRHPVPSQSWPNRVDATMLKALVSSSSEVQDADYYYRTSSSAPTVPASIATAPGIFVPRHIAFYERLT